MNWTTPYVVFRLNEESMPQVVHLPADIAKAKYWMQYIAEPYDVLCKTPAHPKHSKKDNMPEYWSHKDLRGKPSHIEKDWKDYWIKQGWNNSF